MMKMRLKIKPSRGGESGSTWSLGGKPTTGYHGDRTKLRANQRRSVRIQTDRSSSTSLYLTITNTLITHTHPYHKQRSAFRQTDRQTVTCFVLPVQVLFDDIGLSLIRVELPELRLRLLLSFLHILGVPIGSASSSSLIWDDSTLLDDSALLDETLDNERPLTSHDIPLTGVSAVGHMTSQCDSRKKRAGLCKQGEEFVRNVLEQTLPLFPPQDRTEVTLCWMQYEKLKV